MTYNIPFAKINFDEAEETEVLSCLRSGWITTGARVTAFEKAFAEYVGCEEAVAVSSGTAALHLALWTLNLKPEDEVITPSLTWLSVPNLITILGARPVFCDVDSDTLCLDIKHLQQLITSKTKAIVPVHFAGRPALIDEIQSLAQSQNIYIIEDCCHAIGAKYKGKIIGSHSQLCVFSFHPNKNITTAEGGMLTGQDTETLKKIRLLRFHGVSRNSLEFIKNKDILLYDSFFPGLKYNMTDIAASLGIHQLKKLNRFNKERSIIVSKYRELLTSLNTNIWIAPFYNQEQSEHSWHLFNICVEDKKNLRERVMHYLSKQGIQTGIHYIPVHQTSWMCQQGFAKNLTLPNTERIGRTILSLPMFPGMTEEQITKVIESLNEALSNS